MLSPSSQQASPLLTHRTTKSWAQTASLTAGCYLSPSALQTGFQQEADRAGRNGGQQWQGHMLMQWVGWSNLTHPSLTSGTNMGSCKENNRGKGISSSLLKDAPVFRALQPPLIAFYSISGSCLRGFPLTHDRKIIVASKWLEGSTSGGHTWPGVLQRPVSTEWHIHNCKRGISSNAIVLHIQPPYQNSPQGQAQWESPNGSKKHWTHHLPSHPNITNVWAHTALSGPKWKYCLQMKKGRVNRTTSSPMIPFLSYLLNHFHPPNQQNGAVGGRFRPPVSLCLKVSRGSWEMKSSISTCHSNQ